MKKGNSWRPMRWKNPHRSRWLKAKYADGMESTVARDEETILARIYEAGADAMLGAMVKWVEENGRIEDGPTIPKAYFVIPIWKWQALCEGVKK